MNNLLFDIAIIIVVATALGFILKLARQPLIPAYVIAGLLLGPVFQIITNKEAISTLSEIGITFLLFIVGLEINLSSLKSVGKVSIIGGTIRSVLIFFAAFFAMILLGFNTISASYFGVIISFSSTMVVVKILSDRKELDTLHGRIIVGILLMEDILAIFALSFLTSGTMSLSMILISLWKALLLVFIARYCSKYLFPHIFKFAAKTQELLYLAAISTCFVFAFLFTQLGFSISIGAFVAGVTLANLPYGFEIIGKVKSLRDFFSTIFFVSMGTSLVAVSGKNLFVLLVLLLIIFTVKPAISFFTTAIFGYKKRPSFQASISMVQISEFSLIIAAEGLLLGHITQELFSMTVILAVVSMSATIYFMNYEYNLYTLVLPLINKMKMFLKKEDEKDEFELSEKNKKYDVLLVGYDRTGYSIVDKLHIMKKELLVVDYNPEIIKRLIKDNIHCIYGDIGDLEIIERIPLENMSMIISTSSDKRDNEFLIKHARNANSKALVFVTSYNVDEALELYDAGADYVIIPHLLGGEHASLLIEQFTDNAALVIKNRLEHIEELKRRQLYGNSHINPNINSVSHLASHSRISDSKDISGIIGSINIDSIKTNSKQKRKLSANKLVTNKLTANKQTAKYNVKYKCA